jgi:hypothetical protein
MKRPTVKLCLSGSDSVRLSVLLKESAPGSALIGQPRLQGVEWVLTVASVSETGVRSIQRILKADSSGGER